MVNAGGDITALLKLDASGFKTGIQTSIQAVTQFKESLVSIGKDSTSAVQGFQALDKAINQLILNLDLLTNRTKEVKNFKTLASGMENAATAAQRLTTVAERGSVGIESLNTILEVWKSGMSSAEVTIKGLSSALKTMIADATQSNTTLQNHSTTVGNLRNSYGASLQTLMQFHQALNSENATLLRNAQATEQYALGETNLQNTLGIAITKYGGMVEAQQRVIESERLARESVVLYRQELMNLALGIQQFNAVATHEAETIQRTASVIRNASGEYARLKAELNSTAQSYRVLQINSQGEVVNLERSSVALEKNSAEMMKNAEAKLRAMGYTGKLGAEEQKETAITEQNSVAHQRNASAMTQATSRTNQMTSATSRLGKAMSSLKMMGTMVASMLAYNFAHKLLVATGETIHAKSEMEGYFKMLHLSQGEIDDFNKALDETVHRFQRVNKYSLGETISSIGVEFNLTTEEMKKAMDVTSMITSEYLRAGRNANEASLAVKDILQGQFQRLSRETGVKQENLKEAGWSGDTNDMEGLLDALRKVGESRHWDVFAEKANSLNDILTITQNRFGEWSAEMVNFVQPSIVSAFNALMSVGGALSGVLTGLWQWINGEGLVESAVRWTGIATAITTVVGALVSYRTGANLVQLAQMGLRGSITATIFSLKAEEVATYGSRNALVAKVTSLKAEQVATLGVKNALLTKVLGLKAETVATMGLKNALGEEVIGRRIQEATMKGATAQQKMMIYAEYEEQMAKRGTLSAIIAKVAGVNMETFAERGLIVALAQRIAQTPLYVGSLKAEEVAELSTAKAGWILISSLTPLIALLAGIAFGLYAVIAPLQQASEEMKGFNDLLNNGDSIVKGYAKTVDSLKNSEKALAEERDKLTEGTEEYIRKEKERKSVEKDIETAEKNRAMAYEAYQKTVSANTKFNEKKNEIAIHQQTELADAYEKMGFSAREALELTNHEMTVAEKGAEQLRQALARIKWETDRGVQKQIKTLDMLDKYGLSDDKLKEYGKNFSEANYKITEGFEKLMTSDDLMERVGGWFEIQQGRLEEWWTELNAFFEVRDWDGIRDKLLEGAKYVLTGFGAFDWISMIGNAIDKNGIVGAIMNFLFGEGDSDGVLDIIWDWANSMILQPIADWLNWFMEDPIAHFDETMDDWSLKLGKFLFGKDSASLRDLVNKWCDDNIRKPIQDWVNEFLQNPLGHSNEIAVGGGDIIFRMMFGNDAEGIKQWLQSLPDPATDLWNWIYESIMQFDGMSINDVINVYIVTPIRNAISNGIAGIPIISDLLSLFGSVTGENSGASFKGIDLANYFKNGLLTVIRSIPILSTILGVLGIIPSANPTASSNGQGVGSAIKNGFKNGLTGIVDIIKTELDNIVNAIRNKVDYAKQVASDLGNSIVEGIKDGMQMHSPSIISRELIPQEFGVNIPNALMENGAMAYESAQSYGQMMVDGIQSVNTGGVGLGGMVDEYESDAQTIALSSETMGMNTTTAFNDMTLAVNSTTSQMTSNVGASYSSMQSNQLSSLNTMKQNNLNAYNEMYLKSNQSMIQMRDSTSNVTHQMINAWHYMKDQIVSTANKLKTDTTAHFNVLSTNIGDFYRKIQNPNNWGAGEPSRSRPPRPRSGRTLLSATRGKGAGANPYVRSSTMSISELMSMLQLGMGTQVDMNQFLASIMGSHGFGWSGWNTTHYNHIKNTSDKWKTAPPMIMNRIQAGNGYKVGDFNNGQPSLTWDDFVSTAESLFSAIPYAFYYDSQKWGSWQNALWHGEANCSDGADALIALASVFGFSGSKVHTTTRSGIGHYYASINGHSMDTTNFQQSGSWSPLGGAGGYSRGGSGNAPYKSVHVTNDFRGATIYGVDELDEKIKESTKEALREEFNDPMGVAL